VRLRGLAAALVSIAFAVVLAGCKVDATTDVVIRQDGSGTVGVQVELDADAVAALGGVASLRTADIEAAGWKVSPPAPNEGGGQTLSATKPFGGPGELAAIFQEINGPGGPFLQPRFTRERSTFRNRYHFEATVDLTAPVAALDDPQLRDLLTQNGADVDRLKSQYAANLSQAVTAHLVVTMPGADSRSWDAAANQRVEADVSTSATRNAQVTKALVAAALAVVALGVGLTGGLRALYGRVRGRVARAGPVADPAAVPWYDDEWDERYADDDLIDPGLAPSDWGEEVPAPPGWDPYGSEPDPRRG
jgi:hypothetical protein